MTDSEAQTKARIDALVKMRVDALIAQHAATVRKDVDTGWITLEEGRRRLAVFEARRADLEAGAREAEEEREFETAARPFITVPAPEALQ